MKFSIYPTFNRPNHIKTALKFLEIQKYEDFEVVVCDNYNDKKFSSEIVVLKIKNLIYVKPPKFLGMVDNFNYALKFATGDYVCYLTDKMFLLPYSLQKFLTLLKIIKSIYLIG